MKRGKAETQIKRKILAIGVLLSLSLIPDAPTGSRISGTSF
jgi:hypothetical protein